MENKKDKATNTYEYYEKNWQEYGKMTVNIVPESFVNSFLGALPNRKELILELGSGSGNCLKYIHEKGFNVCGSDYVIDIVLNLKQKIPCCSYVIDFSDVEFLNSFIGNTTVKHIFVNAALQHLDVSGILNFFKEIEIDGYIGFSLKEGSGEIELEDGRKEVRYSQRQIEKVISRRYDIVHFERTEDIMGRDFNWLSWVIKVKK